MTSQKNSDLRQDVAVYAKKQVIEQDSHADYPVYISFIDLSKIYMHQICWHWHPELEILIVNHGEINFMAGGRTLHLRAGQGVFINRNVMHAFAPADTDANSSVYSTVFHSSFLFGEQENFISDKFLPPVFESPDLRTIFLSEDDSFSEKILDLVNSVIAANLTKRFGYELTTKACLCQLWNRLLEHKAIQKETTGRYKTLAADEERVKKVIGYLEEHYAEQITLEELSDFVKVSKSECCRCFKRTIFLTPIEYLMQLRICQAVKMIQTHASSRLSMSELALRTGFHNASYFNKVFRQFMHCTPSEYKRAYGQDPTVSPFYQAPL